MSVVLLILSAGLLALSVDSAWQKFKLWRSVVATEQALAADRYELHARIAELRAQMAEDAR